MATLPIGSWRRRAHDPVFWNDITQLLKTVLAAVLAWVLATEAFSLPQSFLAPWAALLVVHATVYRTFSRGLRQVTAAVVGVVLAWAVGGGLGLDTVSVAVVLALGLAIGALPWFGDEATTVAATALVVLATGFSEDDSMLLARLGDTAIGIVVGLLVNAAVWPPLRRRTAIAAMDRIDAASAVCWSTWPRAFSTGATTTTSPTGLTAPAHPPSGTSRPTATSGNRCSAGRAIADADPRAIRATRDRLNALVDDVGVLEPRPSLWPVYGGLMINLRNILDAMDEVAAANPLSQPPLPIAGLRNRGRSARG